MNKTAIKNFAVQARIKLIEAVEQKAYEYNIKPDAATVLTTAAGRILTETEKEQREQLIRKTEEKGYEQVIEETAYTWFNRFIALRFMEVNGYLPSRIRVFTDENNNFEPQILKEAIELDLEGLDMKKVYELKQSDNEEELYKYLLITQCNALSSVLPGMFQKIEDCTELLLPDNLLHSGSVIEQMISQIPEDDWKDEVQIIGWLYQYYISQKKDEVFAALKKNIKITKENIPAATQLFTPDWIVRYMVENSLGRLWLEGHPDCKAQLIPTEEEQKAYLAYRNALNENAGDEAQISDNDRSTTGYDLDEDRKWHYYLEEAEQEPEVQAKLDEIRKEYAKITPEELKVIDPCCGSGHILAYMFDVLMQIYETSGYTKREAVSSIIENNLYGLDIDERAAQLAYFAVMMKGCQYDRRFLTRGVQPRVYAIEESNNINRAQFECLGAGLSDIEKNAAKMQLNGLLDTLTAAKEYGSILTVGNYDWELLRRYAENSDADGQMSIAYIGIEQTTEQLKKLIDVGEAMAQKYDAVVTNPPYMGASGMGAGLSNYVKEKYPDSKSDLFAVFIERCEKYTKNNGYQAMITQHAWMFLSSFEKLRTKLLSSNDISTMVHLGARAFEEIGGEVVQTTSFVLNNRIIKNYKGKYCRLIGPVTQYGKEKMFLEKENRYTSEQANFSKIPGSPVAYWASENFVNAYEVGISIDSISSYTGSQNKTADNDKYLRRFWEIDSNLIGKAKRWILYAKGGEYRKYYGNLDIVVDWSNEARSFYCSNKTSNLLDEKYWYKEGITYTMLTSKGPNFRFLPNNCVFDMGGPTICYLENKLYYILALLNTKVSSKYLEVLNPTINLQAKDVKNIPIIIDEDKKEKIDILAENSILNSKTDWDSSETSWEFKRNPLI